MNSKFNTIWLNGELINEAKAHLSVLDHGVTVGDGVFETLIAYDGEIFAFDLHYQRLQNSARILHLDCPTSEVLRTALLDIFAANNYTKTGDTSMAGAARVRITITGGISPLGSARGDDDINLIIAMSELTACAPSTKVITVNFTRNDTGALKGCKTTSYGENVVALLEAKAAQATEAIFANTKGELCEGTGCNIFVLKENVLYTPSLESGCLGGISRHLVLDICAKLGIEVKQENLPLSELTEVDEAFLTSTLREVQGIGQVNETMLPTALGKLTKQLQAEFIQLRTDSALLG